MKKSPLYISSRTAPHSGRESHGHHTRYRPGQLPHEDLYVSSARAARREQPDSAGANPPEAGDGGTRKRVAAFLKRHERPLLVSAGVIAALAAMLVYILLAPPAQHLTQDDINNAVAYTLQHTPPAPDPGTIAFQTILPSVVRVRQLPADPTSEDELGVGTGVVITDSGTIITNYHVIAGAPRIGVIFADGTKSDADVVSAEPDKDLAVLKPRVIPDDLVPATIRSSAGLRPGDRVFAVGNPFGIGPSVSSGIVSGLNRTYESPQGKTELTNLIQFDAAANPGNSGGPLVTEDGEVVGLVTAILNPTSERVFIGIGFAVPIESAAGGVGMNPF